MGVRHTAQRAPQGGSLQLMLFDAPPPPPPAQAPLPSLMVDLDDLPEDQPFMLDTPDVPPARLPGGPSRVLHFMDLVGEGAGVPVRVVMTDNRHTLLSWRKGEDGQLAIRAHHMFLDAPDDVALQVGRWAVGRRTKDGDRLLDGFMAQHRHLVTRDRRPVGDPQGSIHDLRQLYDALNQAEFEGKVQAQIGWGEPGTPRRRRRRTIQLGCFDPESRTIVIHPALDQRFVPEFFVAAVVFHEMLHEQIPVQHDGDRRCVHGPDFKRREEAFHLWQRAQTWQETHLNKLLAWRPDEPVVERGRRS